MDMTLLLDWLYELLALGAVTFLLYGAWLVFDFHFPELPAPDEKRIEHLPDEVPHL